MTTSITADAQHHDFSAIEAAVKETARGRAFLANYARRVQQSDTLTMLALLGRLERMSSELASRIAELEAGRPHFNRHTLRDAGHAPQGSALMPVHDGTANAMQRIDELAFVLSDLHRHAVRLASPYPSGEDRARSESFAETEADSVTLADPVLVSPESADGPDNVDDEVLGKIAQALEP